MTSANRLLTAWLQSTLLFFITLPALASSANSTNFGVGAQGYDVVAYFTDNKPVKGDGNHVAYLNGLVYLFTSEDHKQKFVKNPDAYLPQYGGWCAFGAAVGKKIPADPRAWAIVDGKLYINLNEGTQKIWNRDIKGNIKKADINWQTIKDKDPANL